MLFQSTTIGQIFILSICFLPRDIRGEKFEMPSVPEGHVLCNDNLIWISCDCSKNMCENPFHPEICGCEEAQECCEDATSWPTYSPPEGSVVCEGNGPMDFCTCSARECEDDHFAPMYCGCEEAQKCCEEATASFSPPEGAVVCEGNGPLDYCGCSDWECNHDYFGPMYCGCEEALECCEGRTWDDGDGEEKDDKKKAKSLR
eukprot:CAMPEP_0178962786 /NCGR_PEP_ID=MMETSP0789-20121207/14586_1 /TAXON_ID=3005 /ORGANISM="Rhizosolenia setigera, Strain CCMP 1694" /LENGTH=201 /DNA_ID=CAMNT_0020647031 /DNA_START=56 /DNA_END=661 /DNA_ORIENTATION=+